MLFSNDDYVVVFLRRLRLLRWLPRRDLVERLAHLARFFLEKAFKVVAHVHAKLGIDLVVPLLQPGKQLDQAGQQGHQARIVAAAESFLDVDVVGADRAGQLQVVIASPGDHQRAISALAVREADPALLGHVELAAQPPVGAAGKVAARVLGWHGDIADLRRFRSWACKLSQILGIVPGQLGAGVDGVFLPLQVPGLFPFLAFAQAARLCSGGPAAAGRFRLRRVQQPAGGCRMRDRCGIARRPA